MRPEAKGSRRPRRSALPRRPGPLIEGEHPFGQGRAAQLPQALAQAYRYVADPRDARTQERLGQYSELGGAWDCTHCYECVTQCPKGVAPLEQILKLRRLAVDAGYTNNPGTRHAEAFASSIKHSGKLNELTLMPKSIGFFNVVEQLKSLPAAINLARAGKLPPLIHRAMPGVRRIKAIFDRVGGRFK